MLPIIRRTRRPLTAPEVATIVPPSESRSDFGQVRSDSLVLAEVGNQQTTVNHKSLNLSPRGEGLGEVDRDELQPEPRQRKDASMRQHSVHEEHLPLPIRWGEGQGGRPCVGQSAAPGEGRGEGSALESTLNHQPTTNLPNSAPSTINNLLSTNFWSLQPGEPANDYHAFAIWLQLPVPRAFRKAADALQCSVQRLRRLATRHNWRSRANAFDNHRARATSKALDQLLDNELFDLKQRAERFRLQEWLLHEQMVEAAFAITQDLKKHPRRTTLADLTRLFNLASTLGRRATGLPLDSAPSETPPPRPNWDAEAALKKIYGDPSEREHSFPQPPTSSEMSRLSHALQ